LQISQFYVPPAFIDLGLGDPQFSLLPLDLMRRAAKELSAETTSNSCNMVPIKAMVYSGKSWQDS